MKTKLSALPGAILRLAASFGGSLQDAARRSTQRAPSAASLILALALVVATTSWALTLTARRSPAEPVQAVIVGNLAAVTQPLDLSPLASLFGAAVATAGSDVRLVGVISVGTQGKGIALLSVDGRPARAERAGKEIVPGLSLIDVRLDRVIVNRGGSLQEVKLPPKSSASSAVPHGRSPTSAPQPIAPAAPPPTGGAPADGGSENPQAPRPVRPGGRPRGT